VEVDWAQGRHDRLEVPSGVAGFLSARAPDGRTGLVGGVGVQPLLDSPRRDDQGALPRPPLDGLKIQRVDGPLAYEGFNLGDDFGVERLFEAPFFASAEAIPSGDRSRASQSWSLISTTCRTNSRKR